METRVQIEQNGHAEISEKSLPSDSYWKWTLCVASAPFILLGFPIHLIFGKNVRPQSNSQLFTSCSSGIAPNSVFALSTGHPAYLFPLTAFLLLITIGFTIFMLISFWTVFYYLVILGELNWNLLHNMFNFFRTLPAVFPILAIWICGRSFQNLVHSFDSSAQRKGRELKFLYYYVPRGMYPNNNVRLKLGKLYVLVGVTSAIYLCAETTNSSKPPIVGSWINYWEDLMYILVLPLYCAFCWAITAQYVELAKTLQNLQLTCAQPTFELLGKIKLNFKQILAQVHGINDFFGWKMSSWVIPMIIFSAVMKIAYSLIALFGPTIFETMLTNLSHSKPLFANSTGVTDITNGTTESDLTIPPPSVRGAVGYIFVACVQLGLLIFAIFQPINANDQGKYLHVLLNDYGTQVAGEMTPELYHAYRLLKYFMHSTMEQESSGLLRLPIMECVPQCRNRMYGYTLRS